MTTTAEGCIKHPDRMALWACSECRARYCGPCMSDICKVGGGRVCSHCGGRCREVNREHYQSQMAQERQRKELSMKLEFPMAFAYPFRGRGKWMIVFGTVLLMLVDLMGRLPRFGFIMGGMQIAVLLGSIGYLLGYMMKTIGDSSLGEGEPPDWPDVTDAWNDLFVPLGRVVACLVISFLPWAVVRVLRFFDDGSMDGALLDTVQWSLLLVGATYLPMALLAVSLWESVWAANPVRVFGGMLRIGFPYLLACGLLAAVMALYIATGDVRASMGIGGWALGCLYDLYFLMVFGRITGLLYCCYSDRLKWFE